MEQIPDIVRGRLQATAKADRHPDANQLAAYAERSLAERESVQVLAHLAECRDCREIVALSAPPLEELQPGKQPAAAGWLAWPVLRWGALAACFVIVGTAVTMHYRSLQQVAPEGDVASAVSEIKSAPEGTLQAKADQPADSGRDNLDRDKKAAATSSDQPSRRPAKQLDKLAETSGELAPPAPAQSSRLMAAPPAAQAAAASPSVTPPVSTLTKTNELNDREERRKDESESAANEVATTAAMAPAEAGEPALGKAKESAQKSARAKVETGAGRFASAQMESEAASSKVMFAPRWTLSSDGSLQRSFDAGKTWEEIHVADRTKFRALAAIGPEIWVGGAGGALYHSSDAGEHWSQVKPVAGGKALAADIIGVEFVDTWHGKLTTTSDGTWTTADGGQSWETK